MLSMRGLLCPFGGWWVESVIRVCSRQAAEGRRKVAHPQRWLSEAKCVGWGVGKSAFRGA